MRTETPFLASIKGVCGGHGNRYLSTFATKMKKTSLFDAIFRKTALAQQEFVEKNRRLCSSNGIVGGLYD
jgi:hypothetical protein